MFPRLSACLAGLGIVLASAPAIRAQDPFAPGLRWSAAPAPGASWLPLAVDFASEGELVWAAGAIGAPRVLLFAAGESGAPAPLCADAGFGGAIGPVLVAGSPSAGVLLDAAQFPAPDTLHRRTEIARRDALAVAHGAAFGAVWTHDVGLLVNGPAKLALDAAGAHAVCAVHDAASGVLRVDRLDAVSGALLARTDLAAASLRVLALAADGSRAALVAGAELFVIESDGSVGHHESLALATNALALSGDGQVAYVGAGDRLRRLQRQVSGAFVETFVLAAAPNETATRCATSADGATFAVGWWDAQSGVALRFEVWSGSPPALAYALSETGAPGGLQNFPEVVALTPDGRRAAFGAWGTLGPEPELALVDVPSKTLVLAVDLPGSVQSLALDPSGTRVVVGQKHAHANQFASTGEFRMYDTGERDLQVLGQPAHGAVLHSASLESGASVTLFLLGTRSAAPQTLPNTIGSLWIDRSLRMRVFARAADAQGRADLFLPLPAHPALIGFPLAVQAAARVGGVLRFSDAVLEPVIF